MFHSFSFLPRLLNRQTATTRRPRRRPCVEPLEYRSLPAPLLTGVSASPSPISENDTTTLSGGFVDPAGGPHAVTINWGDASSLSTLTLLPGESTFLVPHQYLDNQPGNAPYPVQLQVTGSTGSDSATCLVQVNNVAPANLSVSASPATLSIGDSTTLSGSFSDPGTADAHTLTVDWGDGTPLSTVPLAPGVLSFGAVPHQYQTSQPGGAPFAIQVTVTDNDGAGTTAGTAVTVASIYDPSQILVRFQPGGTPGPAVPGTEIEEEIPLVPGLHVVRLSGGVTVADALQAYQANPQVLYAEPDYLIHTEAIPNDPDFGQQGGLKRINAPAAWDVTEGAGNSVVAVLDTGIDYHHPDLLPNLYLNQAEIPAAVRPLLKDENHNGRIDFEDLNNPENQGPGKIMDVDHDGVIDPGDLAAPIALGGWSDGRSEDGDAQHLDDFSGWDFIHNSNTPLDDNLHGTHVAGILGARGNNGFGVAGVDWFVQIMPLKILDAGGNGRLSDGIKGLSYAVAHGAQISNNSWGGIGLPNAQTLRAFQDALGNARAAGHIFVAAAGNDGVNNDNVPFFPADLKVQFDNMVTVAATDLNDQLARFSNFGRATVDLANTQFVPRILAGIPPQQLQ
jgi:hypothetical protein